VIISASTTVLIEGGLGIDHADGRPTRVEQIEDEQLLRRLAEPGVGTFSAQTPLERTLLCIAQE
jgi:hypothetical protein